MLPNVVNVGSEVFVFLTGPGAMPPCDTQGWMLRYPLGKEWRSLHRTGAQRSR